MNFEEFKEYKKLAESKDSEYLMNNCEDAYKIYQWMEESGRIDEGLWKEVWSWLKRNFSPVSRKLHKLSKRYEEELTAEIQAEYGKLKNSKDLNSAFRRSFAGRIADDIEERMLIVAGDDEDYRELAHSLINMKKLKVKRKMLDEFSNKMDPGDVDDIEKDIDREKTKVEEKYERNIEKLAREKKDDFKMISQDLKNKIVSDKRKIEMLGYTKPDDVHKLIEMIIYYQNAISMKGGSEFTSKQTLKTFDDFCEFVINCAKKIQEKYEQKDAILAVREATEFYMKGEKTDRFDKIKNVVLKRAENILKDKDKNDNEAEDDFISDVKDDVTTRNTEDVMGDASVDDVIKDAKEDSNKKDLSPEELVKQIEEASKEYFDSHRDYFVSKINKEIDKFNMEDESEREKTAAIYDWELNDEKKIDHIGSESMDGMFKNMVKIAGIIYPYYGSELGKGSKALFMVTNFMYLIHAAKKDSNGMISQSAVDKIVDGIKNRYHKEPVS